MQRWAIILLLSLAACGDDHEETAADRLVPARPVGAIVSDTVTGAAKGTWKAVQQPFEDVGIKREAIPPLLQVLVKNPYLLTQPMTCEDIRIEIAALDAVLGPDVCTPENPSGTVGSRKGEYIEEGASIAGNQAAGLASSYLDVIPFRGVVRSFSGANKHAKEIARAYEAGKLRRSFLKGLAYTLEPGCLNVPLKAPASH
ncbi:MAG: hypothetical protein ACOYNL_06600 [Rickettsiales bacterium]